MRVFKTKFFARFARKSGIDDIDQCDAVRRVEAGLIDADLGGGVIKQRIARKGQGKSGGFRTIILFRMGHRAIFAYGFAKKDRPNLEPRELATAKAMAKFLLGCSDDVIASLVGSNELIEVRGDGKTLP